jgi:hypothetical protein
MHEIRAEATVERERSRSPGVENLVTVLVRTVKREAGKELDGIRSEPSLASLDDPVVHASDLESVRREIDLPRASAIQLVFRDRLGQ